MSETIPASSQLTLSINSSSESRVAFTQVSNSPTVTSQSWKFIGSPQPTSPASATSTMSPPSGGLATQSSASWRHDAASSANKSPANSQLNSVMRSSENRRL